jgi:LysM repeat protein
MKYLISLLLILTIFGCVDEPTIINSSTGEEVGMDGETVNNITKVSDSPTVGNTNSEILNDSFYVTYDYIESDYVELSTTKPINYTLTPMKLVMGDCTLNFTKRYTFDIDQEYDIHPVYGTWDGGLYPNYKERILLFFNEGEFIGVKIGSKVSVIDGEDITNYIDTSPLPKVSDNSLRRVNEPYIYVVAPGDTWQGISESQKVDLLDLRRWNPKANRLKDNLLPVGTELKIYR